MYASPFQPPPFGHPPCQPEAQLSSIKGKVDALLRMWEHLKRGDEVPDKVMVRDLNACATNLDEATSVARNESRGERCRGCLEIAVHYAVVTTKARAWRRRNCALNGDQVHSPERYHDFNFRWCSHEWAEWSCHACRCSVSDVCT